MKRKLKKARGDIISLMVIENIDKHKLAVKLGKSERTINRYLSDEGFQGMTLEQIDTLVSYLGRELKISIE